MRLSLCRLGATLVYASSLRHAVGLSTFDNTTDPVVISFDVDLHDCPLPCVDYANTHSWIPYLSSHRLRRCEEPLLLQMSVKQSLSDVDSNVLIRACSLASGTNVNSISAAAPAVSVENPKKADELYRSSLEVAPACARIGTSLRGELQVSTNSGTSADDGKAVTLLKGMQRYFAAEDNCDENFLFAYYSGTVASMYVGAGLGKKSAETTLNVLSEQLQDKGFAGNQTVAQICGNGRSSERILGVAVDHSNNLAAVQKAALNWSKGERSVQPGLQPVTALPLSIMEIASTNLTNATLSTNWAVTHRSTDMGPSSLMDRPSLLGKRATCRYIQVISGDGCASLVSRCGISSADFTKFNPRANLCSSLQVEDYVCCSAGDPYTKPVVPKPSPNADGTCATHLIADQDNCSKLATQYGVTVDEIEKWNKGKTWAWTECKDMLLGYNLCVSDGKAPLPPPQAGAACGPLVPGTKHPVKRDASAMQCYDYCKPQVEAAKAEGRTTNYGCIGFWPGAKEIPWEKPPGTSYWVAGGKCSCDNWVLNELADTVLEAMPMIAQIGCYIIMQSLKIVLDIGLQFVPGVGKILDAGLDMATTAAQMASYLYADEDKPAEAFYWWLSPCGGTDLVPDEIKKAFEILSTVADGVSSFKQPKNLKKGSGKKGDDGNPNDQSTPRAPKRDSNGQQKCAIPAKKLERRIGPGKNTIRKLSCDKNQKTQTNDEIIVSAVYAKNAAKTQIKKACPSAASQACYHYSSAIQVNPAFATLTCPPEAASTAWREDGYATDSWSSQHSGIGWQDSPYYVALKQRDFICERDEFPPAYLMNKQDPAYINGGQNMLGQNVRFVPKSENGEGGRLWKGICFKPLMEEITDADLKKAIADDPNKGGSINVYGITETHATMTFNKRPEFTITSWPTPPAPPAGHANWGDFGMAANPCWDQARQAQDPGFAILAFDPWYQTNPMPYNYKAPYVQGANGS